MKFTASILGQGLARLCSALSTLLLTACVSGPDRFYGGYDSARPLSVSDLASADRESFRKVSLYLDDEPNGKIPCVLTFPKAASGPVPCVVFLHGFDQDKSYLETIAAPFAEKGFAMATFDQLMCGERGLAEGTGPVKTFAAMRRRLALTVTETRRLIDYCQSRPDIDGERIYLLGVSFGAIAGATAAAFDDRIRGCVLTYGGGNMRALLNSPGVNEATGFFASLMKPLAVYLLRAADPARYVHRISPRPILFQNGRHDELITPKSARALHQAAQDPKEIRWYDTPHLGEDDEIVKTILDDALDWLVHQNISSEGG